MNRAEMVGHINLAVYGTKERVCNDWALNLANAIANKNFILLCEILAHGKNWNDASKRAFCQIIKVKTVYTRKGIKKLIAEHCDTSEEMIDAHFDLKVAIRNKEQALHNLKVQFSNVEEVVEWVDSLMQNGFNHVRKVNRHFYLMNDNDDGYKLKEKRVREYVFQCCDIVKYQNIIDQVPTSKC